MQVPNSLLGKGLAQHDPGGDLHQVYPGGLAQKRHAAGGSGVDLDDVHIALLIHNKLDVKQALDADAQAQLFRIVRDPVLHGL